MWMRWSCFGRLKTATWTLASVGLLWSGAAIAQTEPTAPEAADPPAPAAAAAPAPKAKPTPQEREDARQSYAAGEAAYRRGDYRAAADQFAKAESVIASPHAKYWLAMSLDEAGELKPAIAAYNAFLDDPNRERAGEDKVRMAEARLDDLESTPGTATFTVEPKDALVTIDGTPVKVGEPLTLETGKHDIKVESTGFLSENTQIDVEPGGDSTHAIVLKPSQLPPVLPRPAVRDKNDTAAYITLGIAAGGVAVGTIFGLKALSAKSDYDSDPTESLADAVERDALISDMAFAAAITLGITGIVLLTGDETPEEDSKKMHGLLVTPYATPHGGGAAAFVNF